MRLVRSPGRREQDRLVSELVGLFSDEARTPKIIDRRRDPVQGYRAVHVIVYPDGYPIEIQVRTRMQHEWAELFEKMADVFGRGIRYGEPPRHWLLSEEKPVNVEQEFWDGVPVAFSRVVEAAERISAMVDVLELAEELGVDTVEPRTSVADGLASLGRMLEAVEQLELPTD